MKRTLRFIPEICLALNCLVLFVALLGERVHVPISLQVLGRMHPLVLHFPIVLFALSIGWELWGQRDENRSIGNGLLLTTAFSAALTALFGLFLAREGSYDAAALYNHKWGGVALSWLAWGLYGAQDWFRATPMRTYCTAGLSAILLLFTGHAGGEATHGEGFVLAPLMPAEKGKAAIDPEQAEIYKDFVQPIFQEKCVSCHGPNKAKGGLRLDNEAGILQGGEHGPLWDTTAADLGLMLRRVHLPLDDEHHMPPKAKAQLTEDEIGVLQGWLRAGASFRLRVNELPQGHALRELAESRLVAPVEQYNFAAASDDVIQKMNNHYRRVQPLALGYPALVATYFGASKFDPTSLADLKSVSEQLVELNLLRMPIGDADLSKLADLQQIRQLNLGFSQVTGAGLSTLKALRELRQLSLVGTAVKAQDLTVFEGHPHPLTVFAWGMAITPAEVEALKQKNPKLKIDLGAPADTALVQLNPPVIADAGQVFEQGIKVALKNFIKGANVRYTLDGTEPDSLTSPAYTGDSIAIDKTCDLQVRAYLAGWKTSILARKTYYRKGLQPDSVDLRTPPSPKYKGSGAAGLNDGKIGDITYFAKEWMGYNGTPLEALFYFEKPTLVSSVRMGNPINLGSYVFPAQVVEIWGGNTERSLTLLKKHYPEAATGYEYPLNNQRIDILVEFSPREVRVIKTVVRPVMRLPKWHGAKGEPGWVFVDEIFIR